MLSSSFGPFGRTKLLFNDTILVITRDAQQILNQSMSSTLESSNYYFDDYLRRVFVKYNEQSCDGQCAFSMLLKNFICFLDSRDNKHRLDVLNALEILMALLHLSEVQISNHLLTEGIWTNESNPKKWMRSIFMNLLTPALNSTIASNLSAHLIEWIFSDYSGLENNIKHILSNCINYSSNLSYFLIISSTNVCDQSTDAYIFRDQEMLISGQCQCISALATPRNRSFLCLRSLIGLDEGESTIKPASPEAAFLQKDQILMEECRRCCLLLARRYNISVVFCSEVCTEDLLFAFSNTGLIVVAQVPMQHLILLSQKCGCQLFEHLFEATSHYDKADARTTPPFTSSSFECIERLLLGTSSESMRVFLKIVGLNCSRETQLRGGRQMILYCANKVTGREYLRTISRCLKAAIFALSDTNCVASSVRQGSDYSTGGLVAVPGCGAAELSWAMLWNGIGNYIMSHLQAEKMSIEGSPPVPSSRSNLETAIASLVKLLADRFLQGLKNRPHIPAVVAVELCGIISRCYCIVAAQLLVNAVEVLESEPDIDSDFLTLSQLPKACLTSYIPCAVDRSMASNVAENRKLRQLWSQWVHICLHGNSNSTAGRVGIVTKAAKICNIADGQSLSHKTLEAMADNKVCYFGDPSEVAVYCSRRQFFSAFMNMLTEGKVFLRLGGNKEVINLGSVIQVNSRKKAANDST